MSTDSSWLVKNVAHKPEGSIYTYHQSGPPGTELSCHLIAVTRRWFYQKLFSSSCICYFVAKRWPCFCLEGLHGKVLVVSGVQGWLLCEAAGNFPHV